MRKKAMLAALMAMILLLSGCALIVKDQAVDNATPIIRMGDQVIDKQTVKAETENQLYQSALYSYYMLGQQLDVTDPAVVASAQEAAIKALKEDMVLTAKAKELGLDQLTDEELATVKESAQQRLDNAIESAKSEIEGADQMDAEALTKAAAEHAEEDGYTLDTLMESETKTAISKKLKEYAVRDVAVTDEEIQAEYESKVESSKESYAGNPGNWASAANNGATLYYTPAGIRRVKQILTKFTDEDQAAIDEAEKAMSDATTARSTAQAKVDSAKGVLEEEEITEEAKAAAQADLDAAQAELDAADEALTAAGKALEDAKDKAFADIDEKADAVLAALDAEGADWEKIMAEYNEDPGMTNNEKGYAVSADMTSFDSAFVEAAMALAKPGDHSGKVKGSSYGYYIIRYEGDEAEGPVALDSVKETISSSLLTTKQNETYNATVDQWVEEAGIKVDLNALKD